LNIFDAIREIQLSLAEAHAEIAHLRWTHDHSMLHGPVCDVDVKEHFSRIVVGENVHGDRSLHRQAARNDQMRIVEISCLRSKLE